MQIIVISVIFYWMVSGTNGCKCPPSHPQNRFCEHKYALVGKVKSKTTGNPGFYSVVYTMEVVNRIKNVPAVGQTIELKTAKDSAGCGVFYEIGSVEYVMAGSAKNINSCLSIFEKTDATWSYIHGKRRDNSYRRNCKCKVFDIHSKSSGNQGCMLPGNEETNLCYFRQALCVRKGNSCVWKNDEGCK